MESVEEKNYAGKGAVNTALTLGGVALGGALLNGAFGNILGGNRPQPPVPELATQRDLGYERELTEKDAKIGKLEAQLYTDQQINSLRQEMVTGFARVDARIDALASAQAVQNTQFSGAIGIIQSQVNEFKSVFKTYIGGPCMAASEAVFNTYKPAAAAAASGTGA